MVYILISLVVFGILFIIFEPKVRDIFEKYIDEPFDGIIKKFVSRELSTNENRELNPYSNVTNRNLAFAGCGGTDKYCFIKSIPNTMIREIRETLED